MHMKNIQSCLLAAFLFAAAAVSAQEGDASPSGDSAANGGKRASAVIFSARYKNLTLKRAYQLQKAYVRNQMSHGARVIGFKAGLTAKGAPEQVGLSAPVTGVLIEEPLANNVQLDLDDSYRLLLEPELAFRVSRPINKAPAKKDIRAYFDAVAPAVELPDLRFASDAFTGMDIIANNAMAYRFIVGDWHALETAGDVNDIKALISCDGQAVAKGESAAVYGGQWRTLAWMVRQLVEQGYTLQPGQVLLTGSMTTGFIDAKPCQYQAVFGRLGSIGIVVSD